MGETICLILTIYGLISKLFSLCCDEAPSGFQCISLLTILTLVFSWKSWRLETISAPNWLISMSVKPWTSLPTASCWWAAAHWHPPSGFTVTTRFRWPWCYQWVLFAFFDRKISRNRCSKCVMYSYWHRTVIVFSSHCFVIAMSLNIWFWAEASLHKLLYLNLAYSSKYLCNSSK